MHVPAGCDPRRVEKVNQDPWRHLTGRVEMTREDFAILGGLYDGEVSYVDRRVGQLVDLLRDATLLDDTLLIVTSDHGENLGDHGLMSHAYCLYETLLRVPLILRWPEALAAGTRVTQQVQTVDIFPTVLEAAGVQEPAAWAQVQGRSLAPAIVAAQPERLVFAEYLEPEPAVPALRRRYPGFDGARYDRALRCARTSRFKYIWASDGRDELYDLARDPQEECNLIAAESERAGELRTALDRWLASFAHASRAEQQGEIDDEIRKKLEDLGYLA
jgi:arylsulfatase A-like enzyme